MKKVRKKFKNNFLSERKIVDIKQNDNDKKINRKEFLKDTTNILTASALSILFISSSSNKTKGEPCGDCPYGSCTDGCSSDNPCTDGCSSDCSDCSNCGDSSSCSDSSGCSNSSGGGTINPPGTTTPNDGGLSGVGSKNDPIGKDPVNLRTGNYFMEITDFTIPGILLGINFTRRYNSKLEYLGPFGCKWTHSYNLRIFDYGTYINFFEATGEILTFTLNNNVYVSPVDFNGTLTKESNIYILNRYNFIKYYFNENGYLTKIEENNGNSIDFEYNEYHQLIKITDTMDREILFQYNSYNMISKITLPDGSYINYSYEYYDSNSIRLQEVTDTNGYEATYQYDDYNNMTYKTDPKMIPGYTMNSISYDSNNRATAMFDWYGNSQGSITYQDELTTLDIDPAGNTRKFEFDADGNFIKYTDQEGKIVQYQYDSNKNVTQINYSGGKVINWIYTGFNLTSNTDVFNNTYEFSYNTFQQIEEYKHPINNWIRLYTYDDKGNLTRIHNEDNINVYVLIQYYADGRISSITDQLGKVTAFTYEDDLGSNDLFNRIKVVNPAEQEFIYSYDIIGRLRKITEPGGLETNIYYQNGRVEKVYHTDGSVTKYTYTSKGYISTITMPDGKMITNSYEGKNDYLENVTLPDNSKIYFGHNSKRNLTSITDRGGKKINYEYYKNSLVKKNTNYSNFYSNYFYDSKKDLDYITDSKGQTIDLNFNYTGKQISIGGINYNFDNASRLQSILNGLVTYTLTYNLNQQISNINDSRGRDMPVQYRDNRQVSQFGISGTGGFTNIYEYDDHNRLIGVKDTADNYSIKKIAYDNQGYFSKAVLGNDLQTDIDYDKAKGVIKAVRTYKGGTATGTGSEFIVRAMSLDLVNEINLKYDEGLKITEEDVNGVKKTYTYNLVDELLEVKRNGVITETYSYNSDGNRVSSHKNGIDTTYTYNNYNQLASSSSDVGDPSGPAVTNYSYDANGNLINKTRTIGTFVINHQYTYNIFNQLTEVTKDSYLIQKNYYDPAGKRIKKEVYNNGILTRTINYFYNGYSVILETDGNGSVIASYQGACCIINGVKYYPVRDVRGSIIALTDTNGNITVQYDYVAYGNLLTNSNPSIDNRYLFCGCQYDEETGLYCMGHRFYDPDTGRFITPDPIGIAGGQLNLYVYCRNNPVNFIDPLGLDILVITWGNNGHALMIIDKPDFDNDLLFDPGGSYNPGGRRPAGGDVLVGYDAQLENYINWWAAEDKDKDKVYVFRITNISPKDEDELYELISDSRAFPGGFCAVTISNYLRQINPFKKLLTSWWPNTLKKRIEKLMKDGTLKGTKEEIKINEQDDCKK